MNDQVDYEKKVYAFNKGHGSIYEYGTGVGFATAGKNVAQTRQGVLEKAIKKSFPPEFINRVDEQIFFNSLTKEDIEKIIDIELRELRERAEESGYKLTITPSAKKFIAEAGYDPAFGARPLKRAVMRYVEDPVSEFIISDRILQGKNKKGSTELRTLKVGLTPEKDNTLVSLKED